ncbi:hypothetical protein [Ectobacillus panaciterrae]|uniref:hypothetical protein n=1 Tax=Ectobacillus panaciterrae TaxID=363872 RepID=UPI00041B6330|nr:hypothetical protein [Ectobacillus panaciterrae]
MNKQEQETKNRLNTTERVAQIEDPQGNEADSRITFAQVPIDQFRLDVMNMD